MEILNFMFQIFYQKYNFYAKNEPILFVYKCL